MVDLLGVPWASWLCSFWVLSHLGSSCPLFLQILFLSPLLFLSGAPILWMLLHLIVSHRFLRHGLFFFIVISFYTSDWIISINLSLSLTILCSTNSNFLLSLSTDFSFQFWCFTISEFLFGSFIYLFSIILFIGIIYLMRCCSHMFL